MSRLKERDRQLSGCKNQIQQLKNELALTQAESLHYQEMHSVCMQENASTLESYNRLKTSLGFMQAGLDAYREVISKFKERKLLGFTYYIKKS